jgi:hypothetical protein
MHFASGDLDREDIANNWTAAPSLLFGVRIGNFSPVSGKFLWVGMILCLCY